MLSLIGKCFEKSKPLADFCGAMVCIEKVLYSAGCQPDCALTLRDSFCACVSANGRRFELGDCIMMDIDGTVNMTARNGSTVSAKV